MSRGKNIIAIDGEAGTGKGTLAKDLSIMLKCKHIDTGAIFRAIALHLLDHGVTVDSVDSNDLQLLDVNFHQGRTILNGNDVEDHIRTSEISRLSSDFSKIKIVRDLYEDILNYLIKEGLCVIDGRDIGSVIAPESEFKFYVRCDYNVRAERLAIRDGITGKSNVERIAYQLEMRDRQDKSRPISPLVRVNDACVINTTTLGKSEQVNMAYHLIKYGHFAVSENYRD